MWEWQDLVMWSRQIF